MTTYTAWATTTEQTPFISGSDDHSILIQGDPSEFDTVIQTDNTLTTVEDIDIALTAAGWTTDHQGWILSDHQWAATVTKA